MIFDCITNIFYKTQICDYWLRVYFGTGDQIYTILFLCLVVLDFCLLQYPPCAYYGACCQNKKIVTGIPLGAYLMGF